MDLAELKRRADDGSRVAQTVLGICFLDGVDTEINLEAAFRYLDAAARQGSSRAMVSIARMYFEGLAIPRDPAQAVGWYEKAASAGEFLAQIELGRIYSRGIGVAQDRAAARKWFAAALDQRFTVRGCDAEIAEAKQYIATADLEQ